MHRILCLLLFASIARAQSTHVVSIEPASANRGDRVTITVAHAHQSLRNPVVALQVPPRSSTDAPQEYVTKAFPGPPSGAHATYHFLVPESIPYAQYDVYLRYDGVPAPGLLAAPAQRFRVTPKTPPRLTAAYPSVGYQTAGKYSVTVVGDGFAGNAVDHTLVLNGRFIPTCDKPTPDSTPGVQCAVATFTIPGRALRFAQIPPAPDNELLRGEHRVQVAIDGQTSQEEVRVTFAAARRGTPAQTAALVTFFVALLIILPAFAAPRQVPWGGRAQSAVRSIFLDTQTNTYSLSKFQFYAWTLAAVYGYVYLTMARSLIQGKFELSPIPEGLPGILLISIGTSTIALGVGDAKPKGAGSNNPRISDFFTTGGIVVPERVQFFVWTLLGVGAWVALVAASDPGTIATLPKVPEGFLYLMGISSAGYLGGKFARQPGPIISSASAHFTAFTIEVHGRNLSPEAAIIIGDQRIELDWLQAQADGKKAPEVLASEDDRRYAKQLRLVLPTVEDQQQSILLPNGATMQNATSITLINPDGQKAETTVTITRPVLNPVPVGPAIP
jgi:hypothetical protein